MLLVKGAAATRQPWMEQRRVQLYVLMLLSDMLIILAGFVLTGGIHRNRWPDTQALAIGWAFLSIFLVIAAYQRCYSIRSLDDTKYAVGQLALSLLVSSMLCMVMIFYAGVATGFLRTMLCAAVLFAFAGSTCLRVGLNRYLRKNYGPTMRSVLIVMDGGPPVSITGARTICTDEVGFSGTGVVPESLDVIGRLIRGADRVIVSCDMGQRQKWATIMRGAGVRGEVVSSAPQELGALALEREGEQSFIVVSSGPLALHTRIFKRAMDVAITIPLLILLSPVMLVVALLIKIEDGGPVFFKQQRIGANNCIFDMLKFRSMRHEAEDRRGTLSTSPGDDRVTRVGAFIRKTSIDELPQLLNVLRSEMSLVGPRPHALGSQAGQKLFWEVDENYWQRHALKPGLTGLAQVRGYRGAIATEGHLISRLEADLEYIRNWSVWRDVVIMFSTARVVIHPNAF